jgi:hypothetical protein
MIEDTTVGKRQAEFKLHLGLAGRLFLCLMNFGDGALGVALCCSCFSV